MSTFNRVVAADETASLAPKIRARLATEMADPTSEVGASLSDTFGPLPSGTPTVGQVPVVSTVSPLALGWGAGGSAGGLPDASAEPDGQVLTTATGAWVAGANTTDFATAVQGTKADDAQPAATLDADAAVLVTDPTSDVGASLSGMFAPVGKTSPARNSSVAVLGDSITSYNSGPGMLQNPGWFWRLLAYSAGRMYPEPGGAVYATAGYTCQDVLDTHVPQIEALDAAPGFVFVACGANDLSAAAGVTYNSDKQATKDAHSAILAHMQAIGAVSILVKVPPNEAFPQIAANVVDWNAYIDGLGKSRGMPVLDMCAPLATDPTVADTYKSGANLDATHPSALGHDYIARYAVANGILDLFPTAPNLSTPSWYSSLITKDYGRFLTDSNSDGLADGWGTGGTLTGVTFARAAAAAGDGALGYWQEINVPANLAGQGWIQHGGISTGWAVGDRVRLRALIEATGVTGATDGAQGVSASLVFFSPQQGGGWSGWFHDVPHGGLDVTKVAPTGTTTMYVRIVWGAGAPNAVKIRLANVRIDNLDATPYV